MEVPVSSFHVRIRVPPLIKAEYPRGADSLFDPATAQWPCVQRDARSIEAVVGASKVRCAADRLRLAITSRAGYSARPWSVLGGVRRLSG